MPVFDLLTFIAKMLGGLAVPDIEKRVVDWLREKGTEYPDLAEKTEALAAWLGTVVAEADLDPAGMKDSLWGIASDIVKGTTGVDPGAWHGGA